MLQIQGLLASDAGALNSCIKWACVLLQACMMAYAYSGAGCCRQWNCECDSPLVLKLSSIRWLQYLRAAMPTMPMPAAFPVPLLPAA